DITNYILKELGQPMHAFDMDTLESCQIIVRRAAEGEGITTLDGKEFSLTPQNLVICDGHKPVALAGVMGGLNSEIKETTTQLLFESAKFARDNIRKTARGLGQNTDASSHYEKGISEYTTELGMDRALHLIQELGCGEITASRFDVSAGAPREGKRFTARFSGINAILGIDVPKEAVLDILARLSFAVTVQPDGDTLEVVAPRWREDVEIGEPDLAEEVIREYGFEHIVPTFLKAAQVTSGGLTPDQKSRAKLKRAMCAQGFYEASTLAFYADADLDMLHIASDAPERNVIRILNPISSHLTIMRPLLAPSLLNVTVENLRRGNDTGRLFELSNVYIPKQQPVTELPEERMHLGFAAFGAKEDFFAVKGAVEALGESFGLSLEVERAPDVPWLHPGIAAYILCEGERIGVFGKLANDVTAELKLPKDSRANQKIFLGEIDYPSLMAHVEANFKYQPILEFPAVQRDLALVVDESMTCGAIIHEMQRACASLGRVELFDVYRGEKLGAGKKSMAFSLFFEPKDKPLDAADIDRFIKKILGNLRFKLGIEIRE
ncbi:MAG: phenylalanine--tRNA ligase subunit beta, partial [Gemmiger sp.]